MHFQAKAKIDEFKMRVPQHHDCGGTGLRNEFPGYCKTFISNLNEIFDTDYMHI